MNAIRIHKRIDSETLHLLELREMVGKTVEIIVLEEVSSPASSEAKWQPLLDAAGQDLVESDAYKELRAASVL